MSNSHLDDLSEQLTLFQSFFLGMLAQLNAGMDGGDLAAIDKHIQRLTQLMKLSDSLESKIARWKSADKETRYTSYDNLPPPSPEDRLRIRTDIAKIIERLPRPDPADTSSD